MRFIVVHRVASYLMVITALLAVVLGAALPGLLLALLGVGTVVSWWWEPPRVDFKRFELAWNIATVVMLAKVIVDGLYTGAVLESALDFVLFLTVNKLFNRRSSRDYLHLYVLSFLQMTAATVINPALSYGVLFLFYVIFTTWTLILFHLKREMEGNYLLKYGGSLEGRPVQVQRVMNSRKLVGPRFLLVTSLLSLVVFIGAASLFVLFPRVGFGYFFKKSRPGISMTGFSDKVELGQFGRIKSDPTVVMRVEFETPNDRHRMAPYWRGISFDRYDGTRWTKSSTGLYRPERDAAGRPQVQPFAGSPEALIKQSIYLEPMRTRMLFGLARLHAVAVERGVLMTRRGVQLDDDGDVHYTQTDDVAINYQAFSAPEPEARLELPLAAYRARAQRRMGRFLQLPAELDPRIPALATRLVGDAQTVGQAVDRISGWLKKKLGYTLDLKRDPKFSPLADFLFVQRKGHCEYFATALVIMLRTQGIAARHVNGFLGGQWNDYGGYFAVSQGDAHSWVEVWAHGSRWITRDPTPSGGPRPVATGFMARIRQYTDSLRMRWYKYIIEYDLGAQVGLFQRVRGLWRSMFGSRRAQRQGGGWRWLIGALLVALLIGAIVWLRRRRPDASTTPRQLAAIARIYESLLRTYRSQGFLKAGQGGTAREALQRLRDAGAPDLPVATAIIARYEQVRFGGARLEAGELAGLRRQVKRIGRA